MVVLVVMEYLQELILHFQVVEELVEMMEAEAVLQENQLVVEEEVIMLDGMMAMLTDMEKKDKEVHTIL